MFEVMSSHSIVQTSGRCLHKQTHTHMVLLKSLLERLMVWSRNSHQTHIFKICHNMSHIFKILSQPEVINRYWSQTLFLHTFNIWNYKHLRLRKTFLKTVEMDCAVKRYEAYFCSSVPRKPENETYGVQWDEISFLQVFFFNIHCISPWLLPSS